MRRRLAVLALALLAPTPLLATPGAEAEREIRALISFVAASDCRFIRNGDAHAAAAAADHLAMKYGKARTRLSTPEQFIEHVATRSYFTGREYRVQCPGSGEQSSAAWLRGELQALRGATTRTSAALSR